jgi:hypothetical protein
MNFMHSRSLEAIERSFTPKHRVWIFGTSAWVFGITDRSIAIFLDGYLSASESLQLLTMLLFFVGWLYLKPKPSDHQNNQDDQSSLTEFEFTFTPVPTTVTEDKSQESLLVLNGRLPEPSQHQYHR